MEKLNKILTMLALSVMINNGIFAQAIPTLELTRNATPTNSGFGTSILPLTATFQNDALNDNNFAANSPAVTVTVSLQNQAFTGLSYGTGTTAQTTGLVFGAGPTVGTNSVLGAAARNRWDIIGAYTGSFGPTNSMFTSNPTATGAQLGTGIKVNDFLANTNGAFEVFTTAYQLYKDTVTYPRGSRVLFGQLKLTFNQPVKNPIVDIVGLGGSLRYSVIGQPINNPASWRSTFFSTELELQTPGVTSTLMSGNSFFSLSGNNILNSNNADPNGGSVNDATNPIPPSFNDYGAATGSVRINGIVQELVYNVYLEGGSASQFAWGVDKQYVSGAVTDPFAGDIWYVSASLDKPVHQISGNVFNDRDGLNDAGGGDINKSAGVANPKTNVGGTLYANLINANTNVVVATMPVSAGGQFLFDAVTNGTYYVQVTTNQGVVGQPTPVSALPTNWVRTGEFIGAGPGSDGVVNGISDNFNINNGSSENQHEVNFGIEQLPNSVDLLAQISQPHPNDVIVLNNPPLIPILQGSDPEDMPSTGVLTNKTVKITTLPTNSTLRYNGVAVTLNQVIPNFNPALLTIRFDIPTNLNFTQFNYAYVDAAGNPDPTPALYRITWTPAGLPITLSEFTASKISCTANLVWKTSSESNGDRFEVEVSTNGNAVYTKAGTVAAAGNSSTTKTYRFSYAMQTGVTYYFRLKMIDKDGSYKYSEIRSLSCSGKALIVIAPNPVIDRFTITGMENGKNLITIFGANGQLVKTQVIAQIQGEVNIFNLAAGLYAVKITSEAGNTFVGKIIKQ